MNRRRFFYNKFTWSILIALEPDGKWVTYQFSAAVSGEGRCIYHDQNWDLSSFNQYGLACVTASGSAPFGSKFTEIKNPPPIFRTRLTLRLNPEGS